MFSEVLQKFIFLKKMDAHERNGNKRKQRKNSISLEIQKSSLENMKRDDLPCYFIHFLLNNFLKDCLILYFWYKRDKTQNRKSMTFESLKVHLRALKSSEFLKTC